MRSGMDDPNEAVRIFEVLNKFALGEVIFHPRTADQMYNGKANPQIFAEAQKVVKHPLIYNGDISSVDDLLVLKELLPAQDAWMIGRGLLSNPFLARQLKGEEFSRTEMRRTLELFHQKMFERYSMRLDGMGHILTKMTQFWEYFSESFDNPHKALKLVKKSKNLQKYNAAVAEIFRNY
jgi:tRNA-dihydrouridine synthase